MITRNQPTGVSTSSRLEEVRAQAVSATAELARFRRKLVAFALEFLGGSVASLGLDQLGLGLRKIDFFVPSGEDFESLVAGF